MPCVQAFVVSAISLSLALAGPVVQERLYTNGDKRVNIKIKENSQTGTARQILLLTKLSPFVYSPRTMTPRAWRKEVSGLSLRELALRLGVSSPNSVRNYESGQREAPNSIVIAWTEASAGAVTSEDLNVVRKAWLSKEAAREKRERRRATPRKPAPRKSA